MINITLKTNSAIDSNRPKWTEPNASQAETDWLSVAHRSQEEVKYTTNYSVYVCRTYYYCSTASPSTACSSSINRSPGGRSVSQSVWSATQLAWLTLPLTFTRPTAAPPPSCCNCTWAAGVTRYRVVEGDEPHQVSITGGPISAVTDPIETPFTRSRYLQAISFFVFSYSRLHSSEVADRRAHNKKS